MSTKVLTVRTGGKTKDGKPEKYDKFVVTIPSKKNGDGQNFKYHPSYPEGTKELTITLLYDDPRMSLEYGQIGYAKFQDYGQCLVKGELNSNKAIVTSLKNRNAEPFEVVLNEQTKKDYRVKDAGYFKFIIPGISGIGEMAVLKTSSVNSIMTIENTLARLSSITKGKLAGLTLELTLVQKDTSFFQNGKEQNTTIFFPSLSFRGYTALDGNYYEGLKGLAKYVEERETFIDKHLNLAGFFELENATVFMSDEDSGVESQANQSSHYEPVDHFINLFREEGISDDVISKVNDALKSGAYTIEEVEGYITNLYTNGGIKKLTDFHLLDMLS